MNAITLYRISHALYERRVPILPRIIARLTLLLCNSVVPPSCRLGRGTQLAYGGIGVVLHSRCQVGDGVLIGQNTTIGGNFGTGVPVVGDNVYIAPGARVLGGVRIGSNVVIGANSVVTRDIPDDCIAGGVPARVLRSIPAGALNAIAGTLVREPIDESRLCAETL
jgi:serine O-acetyltransferase